MKELKKVIGIISWLPDDQVKRTKRITRLKMLLAGLEKYFKNTPVIIIAQNWKDFEPEQQNNHFFICKYEKLGILLARKVLRDTFLHQTDCDYLIMFDDDAYIHCEDESLPKEFFKRMDENPNGFAFVKNYTGIPDLAGLIPYAPSQLNMCAISRYIYEREPMVNINPQKDEGYEDAVFATLLHYKYPDLEFDVPKGLYSAHFKNPELKAKGLETPSTWSDDRLRYWRLMNVRTIELQKYIIQYHNLPSDINAYLAALGLDVPELPKE